MNKLSIFAVFLVLSASYGADTEQSENCKNVLTPGAKQCDLDLKAIDDFCKDGYTALKTKYTSCDSIECENEYGAFDKSCKAKQAAFKVKCRPVYEKYMDECATPEEIEEYKQEMAAENNLRKRMFNLFESRYNLKKRGVGEGF